MQLLAGGGCPNSSCRQTACRLTPGTVAKTSIRGLNRRCGLILAQDSRRGSSGGSNQHNSENDGYNSGSNNSATLYSHRTWLRRQRVLHSEPHPSDGDIIELNVGGSIMVTSRSTLRQVRGSVLALLFDPDNAHLLVRDAAGRVFLDHDPPAFSLALRYLRELRVTGGCPSSVLLPPLPPGDAAPFRSLAAYLGLQIDEAAITAAAARGASIAAMGGGGSSSSGKYSHSTGSGPGGYYRPPQSSPYASRPAVGPPGNSNSGNCAQSQQQQQWWQRQQQRQHQLLRPQLPEVPPSGIINGSATDPSHTTVSFRFGAGSSSGSGAPASTSDAASAAAANGYNAPPAKQQRQRQHWGGSSNGNSRNVGVPPRPHLPPKSGQQARFYTVPPQQQQQQKQVTPVADPVVQHYYIKTSPADALSPAAAGSSPFRLGVYVDGDLAANSQAANSGRNPRDAAGFWSSGGGFGDSAGGLVPGFDVFCSTSSSKHLLGFSLVARESARLDNVFIGVTSANHTDQRGLQIPCFGWRQRNVCAGEDAASAECSIAHLFSSSSSNNAAAGNHAGTAAAAAGTAQDSQCSTGSAGQQQQVWQAGDLVQLAVELGSTNRLLLKVNGQEVTGLNNNLELPTFRQWCWYLALFRGTDVVAVVFEQGSYSVYSGDCRMKRFLA